MLRKFNLSPFRSGKKCELRVSARRDVRQSKNWLASTTVATIAMAVGIAPSAFADPYSQAQPYSAQADSDATDLNLWAGVPPIGPTIVNGGINVAQSTAQAGNSVSPSSSPPTRAKAEVAILTGNLLGATLPIQSAVQTSPPDNSAPSKGFLNDFGLPPLITVNALGGTAQTHGGLENGVATCPNPSTALVSQDADVKQFFTVVSGNAEALFPQGSLLVSKAIGNMGGITIGGDVGPVPVHVGNASAFTTYDVVSLVPISGSPGSYGVQATSTAQVGGISLLDGAVSASFSGFYPYVSATATGSPGGAAAHYQQPNLQIQLVGQTINLSPSAPTTEVDLLVGSVTLTLGSPTQNTASADGTHAEITVPLLKLQVGIGVDVKLPIWPYWSVHANVVTATWNILPMHAVADMSTSSTGIPGLQCANATPPVPPVPVVPTCVASPNPALGGDAVTITCTNGTPGNTMTIPGSSCAATAVAADGTLTCTGTGASLGNNPPMTVTNPQGGTNTGVVPLQITSNGNTLLPPPVPVCMASPNPASATDVVTISCTGAQTGTHNVIPGATCQPDPVGADGKLTCTSTGAGTVAANPTITTTDPATGSSNSGVIPLQRTQTVGGTILPNCSATPNPAAGNTAVTISCTNGTPGDTVAIPGSDCTPGTMDVSGKVTCQGTGNGLGNNPIITVTNPTTGSVTGTVPLVVKTTGPGAPVCTATPSPAAIGAEVTVSCTVDADTTTTLQGATCIPNPATGTGRVTVTCTGPAGNIGSNPTVTSTDIVGNQTPATVPLSVVDATQANTKLSVQTNGAAADGVAQDQVQASVADTKGQPVSGAVVSFTVPSPAQGVAGTCTTDATGVCRLGVKSTVAGTYGVTAAVGATTIANGSPAKVTFVSSSASATTTTLACAPATLEVGGASTCTVTAKDAQSNAAAGTFALSAASPATASAASCTTTAAQNTCRFTVTSHVAGTYTATAMLSGVSVSGSPQPITFTAVKVPTCVASPTPALGTDAVTITCTNGTPGNRVTIPGSSCAATTVAADGTLTCTGTGASLGNNPPMTVTNPQGGTNTGVVPLQITSNGNTPLPPPVPVCMASPNPASATDVVTISCTGAQTGTHNVIPGATCQPDPVGTDGKLTCTSTGAGTVAANPTITTTDPATGSSNSGVIPLQRTQTVGGTVLPNCSATPNPAAGNTAVTISCTNGTPGDTVTIPGSNCTPGAMDVSGKVTCQGTGNDLGNNPIITVTNPTTGSVTGTVPLVVNTTVNLARVVSRRTHGTKGDFDLPLDSTQTVDSSSITIEPRQDDANGIKRVVFIFGTTPISNVGPATLSGVSGSSLPAGTAGAPTIAVNSATGNYEVTVPIVGVSNAKRLLITLTNINGIPGTNVSAAVGYLFGDVNLNRITNSSDYVADAGYAGKIVDGSNFIYDVNINGVINSSDAVLISQQAGRLLER